jgi:hypothetical protein
MKETDIELLPPGMTAARRQLLASMTKGEAAAGAQAWKEHARGCRDVGLTPAPFGIFLAEWVETARADQARPMPEDPPDDDRHERWDYARMLEGDEIGRRRNNARKAAFRLKATPYTNGFEFARKRKGK